MVLARALVRALVLLALLCLNLVSPLLAQPQDSWERLRGFDANQDGKISRDEFPGQPRGFQRMDANADGFITREEAGALRGRLGPGTGGNFGPPAGGMGLLMQLDANGDGKISQKEWSEFFERADENGDEILQPQEWQAATNHERLNDPAPAVGVKAPQVKAKPLGSRRETDLSTPERTTVLIFGSHT